MSRKKVTPAMIARAKQDALILQLKAEGLTHQQIADNPATTISTVGGVSKAIDRAIAAVPVQPVEQYREVHGLQINTAFKAARKIQTQAMDRNEPELALKATDRVLRALDLAMKLYGTPAPVRTDITSDGEPLTIVVNRDWDPEGLTP